MGPRSSATVLTVVIGAAVLIGVLYIGVNIVSNHTNSVTLLVTATPDIGATVTAAVQQAKSGQNNAPTPPPLVGGTTTPIPPTSPPPPTPTSPPPPPPVVVTSQ